MNNDNDTSSVLHRISDLWIAILMFLVLLACWIILRDEFLKSLCSIFGGVVVGALKAGLDHQKE